MKFSKGWTRLGPSLVTIIAMAASLCFLAQAVRELPISTVYAVWTGIGAAGTALLGIVLLGESQSSARTACIGVIVLGIAGLKLTANR